MSDKVVHSKPSNGKFSVERVSKETGIYVNMVSLDTKSWCSLCHFVTVKLA